MSVKKCADCGNEISRKAKVCPICGNPQGPKEYSLGKFILILILGWIVYAVFISDNGSATQNTPTSRSVPPQKIEEIPHAPAIPSDVVFSIISESKIQRLRHNIDVRLNKKVSKAVLSSIALELRNLEQGDYERTFIFYYLPEMVVGSGAWATTNYDPELEVKILGFTLDEEKKKIQEIKNNTRDLVGIWKDESPYTASTMSLYRDKGKLYLEINYKDGSNSTEEMKESKLENGIKLVEKGDNRHGEYFILDENNILHAAGKNGVFMTYERVP